MSWNTRGVFCFLWATLYASACAQQPADPAAVGEWPQFRGPEGLGISREANLPVYWQEDSPSILWQAEVPGAGNSSPIVSQGRVFMTTTYGERDDDFDTAVQRESVKRVVLAYELDSGEPLWETVLFEGPVGKRHPGNTHAAPTPVTDGRYVFVSFDSRLAALDLDGNVVWQQDVDPNYYEESHYGVSSSPVLAGEAVILLQDREEGDNQYAGWLAAFDKRSGEEIWRDEWSHTCCSYNTPLVAERDGRLEVWNQTALEVVGYDAQTGERRWRGDIPSMQTVPSLVREGDLLVAPGGVHERAIAVFHLCQAGREVSPVLLWGQHLGSPEISSPVLYGDRLFSVSRGGALYVMDPRTGEVVWKKRLPPGDYWSSLVAGDGKVYVFNRQGMTTVIDAASEKPSILSRNKLASGSTASPAIAGESLLLRARSRLLRIGKAAAAVPGSDRVAPVEAEPSTA